MQKSPLTLGTLVGIVVIMSLIGFALTWNPFLTDPLIARKAACLSNAKQQAVACLMYASDFDDHLPCCDEWMDASAGYVKNESIFHCPAFKKADQGKYGYAMNYRLSNVRSGEIDGLDKTVLILESVILDRNASSGLVGYPNPSRHKMNVLVLADGHGKAEKLLEKYR